MCLPDLPDTPQSLKALRIMKILCAIQVALGILILFIDIWGGIMLLLGAMMFAMVIWVKNWCICIMYILFCMMDLMTSFVEVGSYFTDTSPGDNDFNLLIMVYVAKLPFYILTIYYTFLAYRELKGIFIDNLERPAYEGYGVMQNWYDRNQSAPPVAQPAPFTGTGYRLG